MLANDVWSNLGLLMCPKLARFNVCSRWSYAILGCYLLSRVSMQCMQSAKSFVPILSVCLSVSPMPILCLNEWTYHHTFQISGRGIIPVFEPYRRCKPPKGTPSVGVLNTRVRDGENYAKMPIMSKMVRDRPILQNTNRKSLMADRSVSRPMTLSDLEGRDANGQTFLDDLRNLRINRLTSRDQIRHCNTRRKGRVRGSDTAQYGAGPTSSKFLVPYWPTGSVSSGRVLTTLDLRSIGREFESWPLRYRVQSWTSC